MKRRGGGTVGRPMLPNKVCPIRSYLPFLLQRDAVSNPFTSQSLKTEAAVGNPECETKLVLTAFILYAVSPFSILYYMMILAVALTEGLFLRVKHSTICTAYE